MTKTFVIAGSLMQCVGHGSAAAVWLTFIIVKKKKEKKEKKGEGRKKWKKKKPTFDGEVVLARCRGPSLFTLPSQFTVNSTGY